MLSSYLQLTSSSNSVAQLGPTSGGNDVTVNLSVANKAPGFIRGLAFSNQIRLVGSSKFPYTIPHEESTRRMSCW